MANGLVGIIVRVMLHDRNRCVVRNCSRLQLWVTEPQGHAGCGLAPQREMTLTLGEQQLGGRGSPRVWAALSPPLRADPKACPASRFWSVNCVPAQLTPSPA